MKDNADCKRRMALRILEMTKEVNSMSFEDLMLIRTSHLEGYGKDLKSALDNLQSIRPNKDN